MLACLLSSWLDFIQSFLLFSCAAVSLDLLLLSGPPRAFMWSEAYGQNRNLDYVIMKFKITREIIS